MARGVTVGTPLSGSYASLINAFEEEGARADCPTYLWDLPISASFSAIPGAGGGAGAGAHNLVSFEAMLLLKKWRWRSTSDRDKRRIDILVHVREYVDRTANFINESHIRINYLKVEADKSHLLQSIRYDHERDPHDCQHPLFHAQICTEIITPMHASQWDIGYALPDDCGRCFEYLRIPTADMTFSSVLLALAADHWPPAFFRQFRERFSSLQKNLPQPDLGYFRTNLSLPSNIAHIKCLHWYRS